CISASGVMSALDPQAYEGLAIGITPDGQWVDLGSQVDLRIDEAALPVVELRGASVAFSPDPAQLLAPLGQRAAACPALPGPWGEDGTVQGLLELAGVP